MRGFDMSQCEYNSKLSTFKYKSNVKIVHITKVNK